MYLQYAVSWVLFIVFLPLKQAFGLEYEITLKIILIIFILILFFWLEKREIKRLQWENLPKSATLDFNIRMPDQMDKEEIRSIPIHFKKQKTVLEAKMKIMELLEIDSTQWQCELKTADDIGFIDGEHSLTLHHCNDQQLRVSFIKKSSSENPIVIA